MARCPKCKAQVGIPLDGGRIRCAKCGAVLKVPSKKGKAPLQEEDNLPMGFHAFRRTFATELNKAGATALDLMEVLGHEDIRTTRRYARYDPKKSAVGRLRY